MTPCESCGRCRWLRWDSRREWCAHPSPEIDFCGAAVQCQTFEPARGEAWGFVMGANTGVDPTIR